MPFDWQICPFVVGLYTHPASSVNLTWRAGIEALEGWQHACPSSWVPTGLSQRNYHETYLGTPCADPCLHRCRTREAASHRRPPRSAGLGLPTERERELHRGRA